MYFKFHEFGRRVSGLWRVENRRLAYWMDFDGQWLKTSVVTQGRAFLGSTRWPATFGGFKFPTVKNGLLQARSRLGERIQDE